MSSTGHRARSFTPSRRNFSADRRSSDIHSLIDEWIKPQRIRCRKSGPCERSWRAYYRRLRLVVEQQLVPTPSACTMYSQQLRGWRFLFVGGIGALTDVGVNPFAKSFYVNNGFYEVVTKSGGECLFLLTYLRCPCKRCN